MVAPDAMVRFAVNWPEPLNVVEFTVTPPGFVVPVTNHCAFAPFLKPLPLTVMLRLMVPWGAALGLVELTWIWPTTGIAPSTLIAAMVNRTSQQCLDFIRAP